jgi:hypothetical protein
VGILPGCETGSDAATTNEQEIPAKLVPPLKIFVDRMARLLGDLKANRSTRLALTNGRAFDRVSVRCHVKDAEAHHVALSEFAVDGEIEMRQITLPPRHL